MTIESIYANEYPENIRRIVQHFVLLILVLYFIYTYKVDNICRDIK